MQFKVIQTDPVIKGATASGNVNKPATIETGGVIKVPGFIEEGETITVNTDSDEYMGVSIYCARFCLRVHEGHTVPTVTTHLCIVSLAALFFESLACEGVSCCRETSTGALGTGRYQFSDTSFLGR